MAGPGGGGRGAGGGSRGGFGGGSFGGGSRGGGFGGHGGPHGHFGHGPYRPYGGWGWGWGWGPRRYRYYGGGCSGVVGSIFVILFLMVWLTLFLVGGGFATEKGMYNYDENAIQDYANGQYNAIFGSSDAYEDNILLVFLAEDDEYYDYAYIAWVGDHIDMKITDMFGNEYTQFGQSVNARLGVSSYKYSIGKNIAQIVTDMESEVSSLGLSSSFYCNEAREDAVVKLVNNTEMEISSEMVLASIESFTESTGIPVAVVVEDMGDVFTRTGALSSMMPVIIVAIIIVVVVVAMLKKNGKNKTSPDNQNGQNGHYNTGDGYGNYNYN